MKYAVANFSKKQYKVVEGQKIEVSGFLGEKGKEIESNEVLLYSEDGKVEVGKPFVKKAVVKAEILEQILGDKVSVSKFKAKTGYRRHNAFRSQLTVLLIKQITA